MVYKLVPLAGVIYKEFGQYGYNCSVEACSFAVKTSLVTA